MPNALCLTQHLAGELVNKVAELPGGRMSVEAEHCRGIGHGRRENLHLPRTGLDALFSLFLLGVLHQALIKGVVRVPKLEFLTSITKETV